MKMRTMGKLIVTASLMAFVGCSSVNNDDEGPLVPEGAYRLAGITSELYAYVTTSTLGITDTVYEEGPTTEEDFINDTVLLMQTVGDSVTLYENAGLGTEVTTYGNSAAALEEEVGNELLEQFDTLLAQIPYEFVVTKSDVTSSSVQNADTLEIHIVAEVVAVYDSTIVAFPGAPGVEFSVAMTGQATSIQKFVDYAGPIPPDSWPIITQ